MNDKDFILKLIQEKTYLLECSIDLIKSSSNEFDKGRIYGMSLALGMFKYILIMTEEANDHTT